MIIKEVCRILILAVAMLPLTAEAMAQTGDAAKTLAIAYLQRAGDPAFAPHRAYTGQVLRDRHPALAGARTAIKESKILGRALGLKFALVEETLAEEADTAAAMSALYKDGVRIFLLDLPLADMVAAAQAFRGRDVILFNPRQRADSLRAADCSAELFHTIPSRAMVMDALAQFLSQRSWRRVLVLEGEAEADLADSQAFQAAARKFGLKVLAVRAFILSNDPRQRDRNNIALLTGSADYDVMFLADSLGEFGRYLPYNSLLPRPVVGSEGLSPSAWHWSWERHGAPQLNQRFDRRAKRRMAPEDWAAWAAVKAAVEAVRRAGSIKPSEIRAALTAGDLTLDLYKGAPGNFRPWNNQLRQPLLLHRHNAVIARAPLDGFLHQHNNLDTLGADQAENACKF